MFIYSDTKEVPYLVALRTQKPRAGKRFANVKKPPSNFTFGDTIFRARFRAEKVLLSKQVIYVKTLAIFGYDWKKADTFLALVGLLIRKQFPLML